MAAATLQPFGGCLRILAYAWLVIHLAIAGHAAHAPEIPAIAIVTLDPTQEQMAVDALVDAGIPFHRYEQLHMASILASPSEQSAIARSPGIRSVHPNDASWALLDRSAPYIGANLVWSTYKAVGSSATIMVVDTGIDGSHPDVRYGSNLVANVVPSMGNDGLLIGVLEGVPASDVDGHGTHVASIVAGTARAPVDTARFRGIAPASHIVGFQAGVIGPGDSDPSFETQTILEAFDYALENQARFGLRIVTNSWGTTGAFDPEHPINQATLELYRKGFVVIFAAGNEGASGPGSLNPYSVAPWVLSIGAGDYGNRRASFSSIGTDPTTSAKPFDHPDLLAPGARITAARASSNGGGLLNGGDVRLGASYYTVKSGTSMAAPHAAATAALLLAENPNLSPDDVYDLLTAGAAPLPGLPVWEGGAGYLSALDSFELARDVEGNLPEFLAGRLKYAGPLTGDPTYSEDAVTVGLGSGAPKAARPPDTTPGQFARDLFTTTPGLILLVGTAALLLLGFRTRRRAS